MWRSGETRCGMVDQCNMTSNYLLVYSSRVNVATCKYVCTMKKRVTSLSFQIKIKIAEYYHNKVSH